MASDRPSLGVFGRLFWFRVEGLGFRVEGEGKVLYRCKLCRDYIPLLLAKNR